MSKHLQSVCLTELAGALTFSSCISVLFILWETHRARVRGEDDHRGALLHLHPSLTDSSWLCSLGRSSAAWPSLSVSHRLPVGLTACLSAYLPVCLFDWGLQAGCIWRLWSFAELAHSWPGHTKGSANRLRSAATQHKPLSRQEGCYHTVYSTTVPISQYDVQVKCNTIMYVCVRNQSTLSDVCWLFLHTLTYIYTMINDDVVLASVLFWFGSLWILLVVWGFIL